METYRDLPMLYQPGHPDADEEGFVLLPNVLVTSALFFSMLKSPHFDSNDVRFVVEAKRQMRSSLVSQRR